MRPWCNHRTRPTNNLPSMQATIETISPTRLARENLGLVPHSGEAPHDFICPLCAARRETGSPAVPFPFGLNFNDWPSLAAVYGKREGPLTKQPLVCGDCIPFMNKPMLRAMGAALVTASGVFALRGDGTGKVTPSQTILHLILYPPEPPFVVTINNKGPMSLSHLIWRAPVNFDKRLIRVRYGDRILAIRRHMLDRTLAIAERLGLKGTIPKDAIAARVVQAATERGEEWTRYRAVRGLFAPNALNFKLTEMQTGVPSGAVLGACTPGERLHLLSLGLGEHFALAYLTSNRPPAAPPALVLQPPVSTERTSLD